MTKKTLLGKIFLISFFTGFFSFITLHSQTNQQAKIDSLTIQLQKDSAFIFRFKKVRPYFALDYRYAAIRSAPVDVKGLQLGVRLYGKHKIGFGGYDMENHAKQRVKAFQQDIEANQELLLSYFMGFYEYRVFERRYFGVDVSAEAGGGKYKLRYFDINTDEQTSYNSDYILPTGAGVTLYLKPVRWIGLCGMAGYRYMFGIAGKRINFNGVFYSYGIWIDLRQIYRDSKYYLYKKPKYRKKVKEILALNT